jgi:starch synthase
MNLLLQRAALQTAAVLGAPMVYHCHDGHAAFLPAIVREDPAARAAGGRSVVTVHNAGVGYHQEIWDMDFASLVTGLERSVLTQGLLRGTVDPLLLSAHYAPLTTVSEQYARELLAEGDEGLSGGLGPALRAAGVPLTGITNGVDPDPFDPRPGGGARIPFPFDPARGEWEGKRRCRERLLDILALPRSGAHPLFGFIGRLTAQKGIDVLSGALSLLLSQGDCPQVAVLGQGAREHEEALASLAEAGRGRVRFVSRFDPELAMLIYASCDFLLIPSAYEPCGLTDYYAQLMGTVPLVHRVGGLVKVRDGETGFSYDEQSPQELASAIRRCARLFREEPDMLERVRRRAFREIFEKHTWDRVAREGYLPLYESVAADGAWKGR